MLPWAEMLRSALLMGLGPGEFWALSVREWRWLSGEAAGGLDRPGLEQLMSGFPDRERA